MLQSPLPQQHQNSMGAISASLYVGDLHPETTEMDLRVTFSQVGPVLSVHLCRNAFSGKSLCYAYVNFFSHSDASKAMACLNQTNLKGKAMRIMWCQRDSFQRKCDIGNLFVKNLDPSVSGSFLLSLFCPFGTVLSCKVAEENGKSKGFGFVQFDSEESAIAACSALHNTTLRGKKLYVTKFVKKNDRTTNSEEIKFTNVYVKNLPEDITEGRLSMLFSTFGKICNVAIMKDDEGRSKGFGFVNFQSPDDARKAVEVLNGFPLDKSGKTTLYVVRAQTKSERVDSLKHKYKDAYGFHVEKLKASNLYVGNLNATVDDNKLRQLFSGFGRIVSVKVMRYKNGISKGFGFVCFSAPEEATIALKKLNGAIFEQRILHIVVAQSKEERFNTSQNYYAHVDPSNCSVISPQCVASNFSSQAWPPSSLSCQPILYGHYDANVSLHYPFDSQIYQPYFSSYVPISQTYLESTGNSNRRLYKEHFMTYSASNVLSRGLNHGNCENLKPDYGRKEIKGSEPANGTSKGVTAGGLVASPVITKKTNILYPFIPNLQPQSSANRTGTLLEMNHSKLPDTFGAKQVKDLVQRTQML